MCLNISEVIKGTLDGVIGGRGTGGQGSSIAPGLVMVALGDRERSALCCGRSYLRFNDLFYFR